VNEHPGPLDALGEFGVVELSGPKSPKSPKSPKGTRGPMVSVGERDEQVQSRGHAQHQGLGQLLVQRGQQGVAPAPLPLADRPDVPLELAGGDQPGQHQLRQRRTAQVGGVFGLHQVRMQPGRRDQPAQPRPC
jgi:hypothetical protein